jgi:cytochrome oxidase Cu insertion factor (SCO1/SenC/PrrC family)
MRINATLLLALVTAFGCAVGQTPPGPESTVGKPAPKLSVSNWINAHGKALSLDKLRGKVVVLDFWAYW